MILLRCVKFSAAVASVYIIRYRAKMQLFLIFFAKSFGELKKVLTFASLLKRKAHTEIL